MIRLSNLYEAVLLIAMLAAAFGWLVVVGG